MLLVGLLPGMSVTALAADGDSTYTITNPSTLNVSGSGWNATDGISATGTLASGKKLTVTATSANSWVALGRTGDRGENRYRSAPRAKETSDGAAKTAWELTTLPGSATLGIDVADYSTKPAGTYTDTVTFTASVEDASSSIASLSQGRILGDTLVVEYYEGDTWNDMVAKYSKLRIIRNWIGFGNDGLISNSRGIDGF